MSTKNIRRALAVLIISILACLLCACGTLVEEDKPEATEQANSPEVTEPTAEEQELKLLHGELLDLNVNDNNVAIVKAKIAPSISDKATIDQNYYNVVNLIRKNGFDEYGEIQYWAVADMSDGSEQKVISFTVPGEIVKMIAEADTFADNTLGEYVTDLWIHPSLSD